jgi:hypothetical protein
MHRIIKILLLATIMLLPLFGFAQKTDTVWFYNGDRAVCEIKSLIQGKLTIKTVAMGTISVEWRNVSKLTSNKYYEIVLSDHSTMFGRIDGVDSLRNVQISFGIFADTEPILDIVKLKPISSSFWKELDGSLNAGFSYTRGTQNMQTSANGEIKYRTNKTSHMMYFSNNISINETSESEKQDGGYRFQLFYRRQVYNALDLRWERNTELGISTRLITVLSIGYSPIENNINVLSAEIGASVNREFSTEQVATNNTEMMIRLNYDLFIFAAPKVFIRFKSETYPSFTVNGRVRSNIDASLSWEVFRDFTLGVAYWGNADNKPVNDTGLTYDWGTNITLGYTF